MSDEKTEKKLTVNDPVDAETLLRIGELTGARYDVGERMLDLEQAKVSLLVTAKQIDDEKARLFNKILLERGLPPNTPVELNSDTGAIVVHQRPAPTDARPTPPGEQPS